MHVFGTDFESFKKQTNKHPQTDNKQTRTNKQTQPNKHTNKQNESKHTHTK